MRIAVSNIAWRPEDDEVVAAALRRSGADAVELAPTAYWPDPLVASRDERFALRSAWEDRGLPVVALQALLYGFPALNLFDPGSRDATAARLRGMLEVAADLGAPVLVFGSPRNRTRGSLSEASAAAIAVPFFRALGDEAERRAVRLCIEPNPPEYGCDFVTDAASGRRLVEAVGSPGFGLHLDAAGMLLAGDDGAAAVTRSATILGHFHFSAPQLGPVREDGPVDLKGLAGALVAADYRGNVSIEMRAAVDQAARVEAIGIAVEVVRRAFGFRAPSETAAV